MRIVRRIFWLVFVSFIVIGTTAANMKLDTITGSMVFAMVVWWFTGAFFSRLIGMMLISSLRCKGCGLEIPAVGQWKIGSYSDHRERHILWAKNPIDGTRIGHIDCPQCSCTTLV